VRRDYTTSPCAARFSPAIIRGLGRRHLRAETRAPADWAKLTFVPKDAVGNPTGPAQPAERPARPVNGAQLRLAQYANDRFRDDSTARGSSPPYRRIRSAAPSRHEWLGLYANAATTFKLNTRSRAYRRSACARDIARHGFRRAPESTRRPARRVARRFSSYQAIPPPDCPPISSATTTRSMPRRSSVTSRIGSQPPRSGAAAHRAHRHRDRTIARHRVRTDRQLHRNSA